MQEQSPEGQRVFWWTLLLATALLLGLFVYAYAAGPATTSDSWHYLAAARSWAESGQLLNADNTPYTSWGPLYPILLAPGLQRVAPWVAVMHAVSLLGCLWVWSWVVWRLSARKTVTVIVMLALAAATPWLITAKFLWSEPVFGLLFALYAGALLRYLDTDRGAWLVVASVAGALLPLQRTSGLFLLMGSGIGLLLAYPEVLRRHPRKWLMHAAVCSGGVLAWLWYGLGVTTQSEVYRSRGWQGLRETFGDYGYVLLRWLVPVQQEGWPKHWLFELALPLLLLAAGYVSWVSGRTARWLGVTALTYLICHVATTVMSRSGGNVYDVERYAAVVYGPFMALLGVGTQRWAPRRLGVWAVLVLWLIYPLARAGRVAHFCHQMPQARLLDPAR